MNRSRWIVLALVVTAAAYAALQAQRPHSNVAFLKPFAEGPTGRPEHFVEDPMGRHLTMVEFKTSLRDETQIIKLMQEHGWMFNGSEKSFSGWRTYRFLCPSCPAHWSTVVAAPYEEGLGSVTEYNRDCPLLEKIWLFISTRHWRTPEDLTGY